MWDAQDGRPLIEPLKLLGEEGTGFAQFSPAGEWVIAGEEAYTSVNNAASVWNVEARKPAMNELKIVDALRWADFTRDGKRVVTASGNAVRVWETETGTLLAGPMKHEGQVHWTRFDPAEERVVTISGNAARVWNAKNGNLLLELIDDHFVSARPSAT